MARTIENEGMLMKVTLEARTVTMVMKTKRGDASNWKGFKLSQTHRTQSKTKHK